MISSMGAGQVEFSIFVMLFLYFHYICQEQVKRNFRYVQCIVFIFIIFAKSRTVFTMMMKTFLFFQGDLKNLSDP